MCLSVGGIGKNHRTECGLCRLPKRAELAIRAAEESLKSDLDVAGLKAQVLGRVEELETREREREEILSELIPAMEAEGYDTGAVKAVMGGWAG